MTATLSQCIQEGEGQIKFADQTEAFLQELTDLSHKYGIGITGSPTLFIVERDDFALAYGCDDESNLTLC